MTSAATSYVTISLDKSGQLTGAVDARGSSHTPSAGPPPDPGRM